MEFEIKEEEFYFDEIDCPNCANKVEVALNKSSKIIEAQVIYLSNKIKVKHQQEDIFSEVVKIVKSLEKETNVFKSKKEMMKSKEKMAHHHHHHEHEENCSCSYHHEHHHEEECCCGHHHEEHHHENNKDFQKKIAFIIGCILFGIASIVFILGNEEILGILNVDPILTGDAYLIPVFILFISSYILLAYDLIYKSIYGLLHKDYFNESLLMVIASMGAIVLSFIGDIELFEACAVVLLYKIGELLQDKALEKSRNAITSLIDLDIDEVTTINGLKKNINEVKVGEKLTIKVGEKIPLDGKLIAGSTNLDMKVLTGESEPIYVSKGDEVLAGSLNLTNVVTLEVIKENEESTISKVKKVVEEANEKKAKSEQFVTKFARVYTPIVLVISLVVLVVLLILKKDIQDALNSVFAILVISCPCSLVISIPLAYFASLGNASKKGVLVKGSNFLEVLSSVETVIFDKTGTITKGEFKVVDIKPVNISKGELLNIASKVESYSNHPIAQSICKECLDTIESKECLVEEIAGHGLKMIDGKDTYIVGNDKLMIMNNVDFEKNDMIGSVVYVSKNYQFLGSIVVRDEIKNNAKTTIFSLKSMKINTVMLTGDKSKLGKFVSEEVGIDEVKTELLPQDKYQIVDDIVEHKKRNIVYVGDGINDTPSIKRADVGIALGDIGSSLAKEASDIVIMNDDISRVSDIIKLSKFTKKIIVENLIFILITKLLAMLISITGILNSYAMLIAIFADVGVCLLCVLNSLRIMKYRNK